MKDGLNISQWGSYTWWKDYRRHRISGPAYISPYRCLEVWWFKGVCHNLKGPSRIRHKDNHREWHILGVRAFNEIIFWDKSWRRKILLKGIAKEG
jgi:hypothetical protein